MSTWFEDCGLANAILAAVAGWVVFSQWPFPQDHALLQLILLHKPYLFYGLKYAYVSMCFTTPYITLSVMASLAYIFMRAEQPAALAQLPPYPEPSRRAVLSLVVGEVHHAKKPESAEHPHWLTIPERGLYTGIAVLGAVGSGKTSGCMHPFAEQIFAYRADDQDRRIGGLVLEVKGDFCHKVRGILEKLGRGADYVEVSLHTDYRYNPFTTISMLTHWRMASLPC